jgi:hypothetical protein
MKPLDDAVVHRHVAVFEEAAERDVVVGEVAQRDAEGDDGCSYSLWVWHHATSSSQTSFERARRSASLASGLRSRIADSIS